MSKTIRALLIGLAGVILIATIGYGAYRVVKVNQAFPAPTTFSYGLNQAIKGGEVTLRVTKARLMTPAEIRKIAPDFKVDISLDGRLITDERAKILLIDVCITNKSEKAVTVPVRDYSAQSRAWSNGADPELLARLNDAYHDDVIAIGPKKTMTAYLAYSMYDFQFASQDEWRQVYKRPYELVVSLYPNKNVVALRLEK